MHLDIQHDARTRALRSADHLRSGPFVIRFDADWATPFANYAIPDDGAQPTAADIDALVLAFRDRERLPRLEYLPPARRKSNRPCWQPGSWPRTGRR